jgi:two-component system sensor kinase FixL
MDVTDPITVRARVLILCACAAGVALLIILQRRLGAGLPLGPLFFLPLLVAAAFVPRWTIFLAAIGVAVAQEYLGSFSSHESAPTRLAVSMVAFLGGALFGGELVRNRRVTMQLLRKTREEATTRLNAEREIRALIEASPAAVLTLNSDGTIAMANDAARQLLGFDAGSPEGQPVEQYVPALAKLLTANDRAPRVRTMFETTGRRQGGEPFYLQMSVCAFDTSAGPRLAAIITDTTEQLREREESGLRQLLSSSKIVAGAVSHEIRNLTAAAAVLHNNLGLLPGVSGSKDFEALGMVLESVVKLSSAELADEREECLAGVDVAAVLNELRMIITPGFKEAEAAIEWEVAPDLPHARAERSGLIQVFLNLAQNSRKALEHRPGARLRIAAYRMAASVVVRFADNGPGPSPSARLFQPFQPGASSTGLGLFISRAIVRRFGGELHHAQHAGECCFIVELPAAAPPGAGA